MFVRQNIEAVNNCPEEIDVNEIPTLMVMNKIDVDDFEPRIDREMKRINPSAPLSAQSGVGIPQLFRLLTERLSARRRYVRRARLRRRRKGVREAGLSACAGQKESDGSEIW